MHTVQFEDAYNTVALGTEKKSKDFTEDLFK